jgi:hypothetical protein
VVLFSLLFGIGFEFSTATGGTLMSNERLFAGQPGILGGLSNEDELAGLCPEEFKNKNPWSDYAMKLFYRGGNIANWKWKSNYGSARRHQRGCFSGLLGTFSLPYQAKTAVAGWMLSEMLSEVPEYVPDEETKKA